MVEWAHAATIPIGSMMATRTSRVVLVSDRSRPIAAEPTRSASPGRERPPSGVDGAGREAADGGSVTGVSTADDKPMSGTTFVVMTLLMVLGALFLLRWLVSTVAFLFNTLLLVALIGGAAFLFLKARRRA